MTRVGLVYLLSAVYLSGVISLAISLHENDRPGRIARETLRRWAKFLGLAGLIGALVWWVG